MNEQFDRALRNHIRDTFDHYDDLMADDGWKKFNEQKNRKRRGLIFWYGLPSGIAAALALLWIFNLTTLDVAKPKSETIAQNKAHEIPESTTEKLVVIQQNNTVKVKQEKAKAFTKNTVNITIKDQGEPQIVKNNTVRADQEKATSFTKNIVNITIEDQDEPHIAKNIEPFANNEITRPQILAVNAPETKMNGVKTNEINSPPTFDEINFEKGAITPPSSTVKDQEYLTFNNSLLADKDNTTPSVTPKEKKTKKSNSSNFKFSVDANTYYSFTNAGVTDDLNLGLGILSELKLTKNLSVNSGISLNKQTTRYVDNRNAVTENKSFARTAAFSNQPVSVPEEVETSAKLVGFEIPLNLKYNVAIGKLKTFVTSGISSYSLLNQSYTNDLSVINYSFNSAPTTTILTDVDKETEGAFSNFQFARTVNFSFGILYPVSTKNSISVEPFLRYPIAGFGSQNLEIGSGGVSFKLNFGR